MDEEERQPKPQAHHRPEFIIIDEEHYEETREGEPTGHYYESFNKLHEIKPSMTIRLVCLFSSLVLSLYAALVGVFVLIALALTLVTLGQVKSAVLFLTNFWGLFIKLFVIVCGLFVGFFSPTFGLGVIVLFFVLQGDKDDPLLSRIIQSRFYKGE